jgi:hypothetical protein
MMILKLQLVVELVQKIVVMVVMIYLDQVQVHMVLLDHYLHRNIVHLV